jgi:hypothetical protein
MPDRPSPPYRPATLRNVVVMLPPLRPMGVWVMREVLEQEEVEPLGPAGTGGTAMVPRSSPAWISMRPCPS